MILDTLRQNPTSRAELARGSGLTKAAITGLVTDLLGRNLIRETATAMTAFGRRPVLLSINPAYAWIIALNLSRVGINIGLADFSGKINARKSLPDYSPAELLPKLPAVIKDLLLSCPFPDRKILGLGITAPGPLDRDEGRILNPPDFALWHNVSIVQPLSETLGFPVFLENNAAAAAIAEFHQGKAGQYDNFLVLTVDSGIGAGLFLNRRPYQDGAGLGQEVGHMTIDWQGKACSCGSRGCLERYAAIPELLADAAGQYGTGAPASWQELVDRAIGADSVAGSLLERQTDYLAAGLVNMRNFLELDSVILAGDLTYKPELLLRSLKRKIDCMALTRNNRQMALGISSLETVAGLVPAAAIVLQNTELAI